MLGRHALHTLRHAAGEGDRRELAQDARAERAEGAQRLHGLGAVVEHERVGDLGAHRVQAELERGDDAEVAAAAAQRPEKVGVLVGGRTHDLAAGGHQLGGVQVVAAEAVLASQPPDAAAERESGHAGLRDQSGRRREPEGLGRGVHVAPDRAALHLRQASLRVDLDGIHRRQVDHDAAFTGRRAGDVVPAAANGERHAGLASHRHGGGDVLVRPAARDGGRPLVDHPVPDGPRRLVLVISCRNHLAREARP